MGNSLTKKAHKNEIQKEEESSVPEIVNDLPSPIIEEKYKTYEKSNLKKYPTVILNTNLIIPIILYMNNVEILMDALVLIKTINSRLTSRIIKEKKNFFCDKLLSGRQDMNEVYCEFDMKDYHIANSFPKVNITVETKDQGWASVSASSSWVELRFKNKITNKEKSFDIGRNFKEKNFKSLKYNLNNKCEGILHEIFEQFLDPNNIVQVVARSMYPGWVCYIRRAEFIFKYFKIDREF